VFGRASTEPGSTTGHGADRAGVATVREQVIRSRNQTVRRLHLVHGSSIGRPAEFTPPRNALGATWRLQYDAIDLSYEEGLVALQTADELERTADAQAANMAEPDYNPTLAQLQMAMRHFEEAQKIMSEIEGFKEDYFPDWAPTPTLGNLCDD